MKTVRMTIDPAVPATLASGRIDPARVDATTEADIAKQAAEDAKRNAETEANAIISKAKLDASYLARQIDDEHMKRHQEMLSLKGEIEQYKMQIKSLCANVMKMVDNID